MPTHYITLIAAILFEIVATSALNASQQFTRLWPSVIVVIGYCASFYLLSMTLKVMPVGVVYAIWSGVGIVLVAGVGLVLFGQKLDLAAIIGISLILAGVLVINLFSSSSTH
ncbi:DMT family transporter [Ketogulonicigenium vulgare]|uniref:Quaternary ammonium compound-resistance protein QacE n=1 Tax=Ketogulonicigenium vulgare (strain WSH-001) TaxID=759362 RepID=F9Y5X1_KETVW|nr:SMR family transporter [Ketogulonicigenium vulgare]ADO42603.1 multidrug resistance efflux protein, SMR family protein [Ketogulonicigenium vulgare Y25]AEM40796.1 quaternary ammonium compound-resistance protein QacE [Ketogulonicigenium vulgare WSH-001]ALJ80962.1 transporter [Ketogulonicigenium vulgare]ANW33729.1 transporter [Ketogulonicigenium vulgare]AOZ54514.1 multidrug resistance efflux protein, SMR family protein [Ketogulonicigenium vulgare]